jgi:hypothetical protein
MASLLDAPLRSLRKKGCTVSRTTTPTTESASRAENPGDLSAQIAATIEREPGDQVRCRSIGGDRYRCNWWAAPGGPTRERGGTRGLDSTELRVRKSRLLHVTRSADRLIISETSGTPQ